MVLLRGKSYFSDIVHSSIFAIIYRLEYISSLGSMDPCNFRNFWELFMVTRMACNYYRTIIEFNFLESKKEVSVSQRPLCFALNVQYQSVHCIEFHLFHFIISSTIPLVSLVNIGKVFRQFSRFDICKVAIDSIENHVSAGVHLQNSTT